jgi:hypothetical protein
MNNLAILEAYRTGTIAPHPSSLAGAALYEKITSRDGVTCLVVFEIDKDGEAPTLDAQIDKRSESILAAQVWDHSKVVLDMMRAGLNAAVRAFANPPVNFAERRLMDWFRASLPSVASELEHKNTLHDLADAIGSVTFDFNEGAEYEDDEGRDVTEETRMRRIDTLATLWLLRRAREREEAKRHAALILDAVTAAADNTPEKQDAGERVEGIEARAQALWDKLGEPGNDAAKLAAIRDALLAAARGSTVSAT